MIPNNPTPTPNDKAKLPLNDWRELCEKASVNWTKGEEDDSVLVQCKIQSCTQGSHVRWFDEDRTLAIAARTALPALLDEVQRLEGELAEARKDRWTCFHCGFETSDPMEAQAHFGERDDAEEFTPLCKWWSKLTTEERAQEIQDLNRQIASEQDDNALLRTRIEGLEHLVEGQHSEIHSFKPFRQCDTIQQVFNVYDSMEGRALVAEGERDRLIAENAELRKDKELLDRLSKCDVGTMKLAVYANGHAEFNPNGDLANWYAGNSLREAIDAALNPPASHE